MKLRPGRAWAAPGGRARAGHTGMTLERKGIMRIRYGIYVLIFILIVSELADCRGITCGLAGWRLGSIPQSAHALDLKVLVCTREYDVVDSQREVRLSISPGKRYDHIPTARVSSTSIPGLPPSEQLNSEYRGLVTAKVRCRYVFFKRMFMWTPSAANQSFQSGRYRARGRARPYPSRPPDPSR